MIDEYKKRFQIGANIVRNKISVITIALCAALAVSLLANVFIYGKYSEMKRNPEKVLQEEAEKLIKKVSQLIVFPEGETPTVATVTDPERLKAQQFFSKAKSGDKVLIFTNSKKAILYDPAANKILEVAPLNIGR